MNNFFQCLALTTALSAGTVHLHAQPAADTDSIQITSAEARNLYKNISVARTSVHDPSVVYAPDSKQYYIFGSHMGTARSTDLLNWTGVTSQNPTSALFGIVDEQGRTVKTSYDNAFHTHQIRRVKALVNGAIQEVDFGNFDAAAWHCSLPDPETQAPWTVAGNMWAPDVIYNPTLQKWCYYLSLNGPVWNSCIILLTANSPEGPYVYQGPVVFTGFNNDTDPSVSFRQTDLEIVLGKQNALPARYNKGNQWGTYWPHAIDPCVFFDEEGRLWMTYGSWSGGIYILQLDRETGLRDYTVTYGSDYAAKDASVTSDPYFGKKIAGGYYVSGEGSYIQHIGDYYYLFMSYGGFSPDGGYEMRIFRSAAPDGPYKDSRGTSAIYTSWQKNFGTDAATDRGEKIMGAYKWDFMTVGECAQGHNSAVTDEEGRAFVVYHTKFNDGTYGHQVRTHQLFTNRDGWLVCAPFEYKGEATTDRQIASTELFDRQRITGEYRILWHKYRMKHQDYEEITPATIQLHENGTVGGDYTGTWRTETGTAYITLVLNRTTFKGVLVEQQIDPTTIQALCFTAMSSEGVNVWGCKMEPQYAVAYNVNNVEIPIKNGTNVNRNLELYQPMSHGATLEWQSSRPDVISATGKYAPEAENVPVELTARISCGRYFWQDTYSVTATKEIIPAGDYLGGLRAYYNFDDIELTNHYNTTQRGTLLRQTNGTRPELIEDVSRFGKVLHQHFGTSDANSCSYTRFTNPLKDADDLNGFSLSMWIKRTDANAWDAIWCFYNAAAPSGSGSRLYLTGNSYIGYNDGRGNYFDINHPGQSTCDYIPVGQWTLVTLTFSTANGCRLYINGVRKNNVSFGASTGSAAKDFDYTGVLGFIQKAPYLLLGYGSFWGSADVMIDDLLVYDRELTATDVRALSTMSNRVTDFTLGIGGTGINNIASDLPPHRTDNAIYDLTGRRVTTPGKGIYIVNGKKTVYK